MKYFWLSNDFEEQIIKEIEKHYPNETGGVLMGYTAENGDAVVTDIISAGPNAKRSKYSFVPDQKYQIAQIASIFNSNNGFITYLGDWHSHPSSSPDLSRKDKRTLTNIAITSDSQCNHPIMMIYGSKPYKWNCKVVRFSNGKSGVWSFFSCEYEELRIIID